MRQFDSRSLFTKCTPCLLQAPKSKKIVGFYFKMLNKEFIIKGPSINYKIPIDMQLGKFWIDCLKERAPEEIFCVDGITNSALTCGEVIHKCLQVVHVLLEWNVNKDDKIAIISENNIEYCIPVLAAAHIGAVICVYNPLYSLRELKHALSMSKPKIVFCTNTALKNLEEVNEEVVSIQHVMLLDSPGEVENFKTFSLHTLENILTNTPETVQKCVTVNLDDVGMILMTSGTTGHPKGAMLTVENLSFHLTYTGDLRYCDIKPGYVLMGVLPFFHVLGFSALIMTITSRAKLVVLPSFKPDTYLNSVDTYKINVLYAVPSIISFLYKHQLGTEFDLSHVKFILCGGGSLGKDIQEEFSKRHPGMRILQFYGLTETTGPCTIFLGDNVSKVGSVGYLIPGMESMVWDSNLMENVGLLKTGELCFKGDSIMKGYVGQDDNSVDQYGFIHTGDIGYYDEDGYFFMIGRSKELIKYKGFQVAPAELEDLLTTHPAVKDCGVIGVPDERAGELPAALIVLETGSDVTEQEIVDFVAERISVSKHLHGGVRFVERIPRNATGKLLRAELKELYNMS